MNDDNRPDPADRLVADQEKVFEDMWPQILSDTVIELFAEHQSVTKDLLIETLERRRDEDGTDRLTKAKIRGALRALRG